MGEKKEGQIIGGVTWILARALVVDLTPPRKLGEVYGLYNMGGKFGSMLGPLVWGGNDTLTLCISLPLPSLLQAQEIQSSLL